MDIARPADIPDLINVRRDTPSLFMIAATQITTDASGAWFQQFADSMS